MAIHINNNSNCYGRLSSCYTYDEQRHEHTLHPVGIEQAVDSSEIDVDGIQHQLNRDEHSDKVASCDKAEDADKEQLSIQRVSCVLLLLSSHYEATDDACQKEQRDELEWQHILILTGTHQCGTYLTHGNLHVGNALIDDKACLEED